MEEQQRKQVEVEGQEEAGEEQRMQVEVEEADEDEQYSQVSVGGQRQGKKRGSDFEMGDEDDLLKVPHLRKKI